MKKVWNKWIVMIASAFFVSMLNVTVSMAHDGGVSLQVFYDELQPHGTWIAYENYGYVWRPRVDRDFVPYVTDGYWINTEYGNTWVSDYGWGWAPFHYGRWFYDDFYGWMWVPDTEWGPAWVAWRSGGGYYGWAPLMPGITVSVSYNYYDRIPDRYWSFVPCRYITYRTVHHHCVPRPQVVTIIHQTTIVTHHYTDSRRRTYFTGPSRREIERVNNTRVPVYAVNDRSRPGRTEIERDRVSFYKPDIDNNRESRAHAIPSRVERRDRRSTTDVRSGQDENASRQSADDRRREVRDSRERDAGEERARQPRDVPRDRDDQRQPLDRQNREREDARRQQEAREQTSRDNANRHQQEERVRDQQRQQDQQRQEQQARMRELQREQQQRQQEQRVQEQQQRQQRMHEQRQQDQQRRQQDQQMRQERQQRTMQPQRQQNPSRMESPREHRGNGSRRRD